MPHNALDHGESQPTNPYASSRATYRQRVDKHDQRRLPPPPRNTSYNNDSETWPPVLESTWNLYNKLRDKAR